MDPRKLLQLNRDSLATKLEARTGATQAIAELRAKVEAGDTSVTDEAITHALNARSAIDAEITELERAAGELRAEIERDDAMERLAAQTVPGSGAQPTRAQGPGTERSPAVVISEPRTYSERTNIYDKVSFFADAWNTQERIGDWRSAAERMERHATEVRVEREAPANQNDRAVTTTSFGSLVVPQYLTDMVAPLLRNGRPLANLCNRHELPSRGMQLIIPRVTTGTSAAVQATQNTAVSLTDLVVTDLTLPVATIAGQADVSRQALERGDNVDGLIYLDLARAHAAAVDVQVINGSGTAGQVLGILNTSGISAATAYGAALTVTNFNLKVAGQITAVTSAGAGLFPTMLVMHPRRWGWLTAQVDASGRPVVTANTVANFNALAVITKPGQTSADGDPITGGQFIGIHNSGLPVLTDLNMPTAVGSATGGEDLVLASANQEYHLWEEGNGLPRELKFEQTTGGSLTTKLVVYSYVAFTAGRYPQATGKIGGLDTTTNGQVAPAF